MKPVVPDGGYFVIGNYTQFGLFKILNFHSRIFLFDILNSRRSISIR
jgi:hypothetical protein